MDGWVAFDLLHFPKGRDTAVSLAMYHPDPASRTACPALEVLLKMAFICQLPPTPVPSGTAVSYWAKVKSSPGLSACNS